MRRYETILKPGIEYGTYGRLRLGYRQALVWKVVPAMVRIFMVVKT